MYKCKIDKRIYKKVRRAKPSKNRHLINVETGKPFSTQEIKSWAFCWHCADSNCPKDGELND